jgi:pilus assembly protein CpaF
MEMIEVFEKGVRHFLKPVLPLIDDPTVSEILINGPDVVYFERAGRIQRSDLYFPSPSHLMAAVRNIAEYVHRTIDEDHHSMDARLPDGSRVHVIIPPAARHGAHISIRKFQKSSFDLDSLVDRGSLTAEVAEFLRLIVMLHKNVVISGGTGTGKTSMLNAVSAAISDDERIVVIEDSSELQLNQPHTVYLEMQPPRPDGRGEVTIRQLFADSLRMRPDRIIVGEVRRGEALDMIQSMISGHAGALTTVHASTPQDALIRLEMLCLMAGIDLPVYVARRQVASAIHLVVQLARMRDGSRRVQRISELTGLDDHNAYQIRDLYAFRARGVEKGRIVGLLEPAGAKPSFAREPYELGLGDEVALTSAMFPRPES